MKKTDWTLLLATGAYSFLFYQQSAGINFFLFTCVIIALIIAKDKQLLKNRKWMMAASGSILSAICIAWYGNTLSVVANIISLSLLAGLSFNTQLSVILSILFAFYSYIASPITMFMNWLEKNAISPTEKASSDKLKKAWLVVIPIGITLLFFFMYRASNPIFNDFSKRINFDFISWNWITFTFGGCILMYGFFNFRTIKSILKLDDGFSDNLPVSNEESSLLLGKTLRISDEYFSGKVLFISLNVLILLVNVLDINFFFIDRSLPEGITFSEFLHQGTGMLIISIVIAIAIILFYFRGSLNFYEKSKTLKLLVYLWIIQNAFMLFSTALRNSMYIQEYGLTYKRIGVYVYLLLTLIGLTTTFIKIARTKSNNYLFRTNGWLFYTVLIISSFFSWDVMINNYNINNTKNVDINYLMELSDSNLPQLFNLYKNPHFKQRINSYQKHSVYAVYGPNDFEEELSRKLYDFLEKAENSDWQSWNYKTKRLTESLKVLNYYETIQIIALSNRKIDNLDLLKDFTNIQSLYLTSSSISDIQELMPFKKLKTLNLENNKLNSINGIETLKNIEKLYLKGNNIDLYSPLYSLKHLKELSVDSLSPNQLNTLKEHFPNTTIL